MEPNLAEDEDKRLALAEMNSVYEKFRKRIVEEDNIINHRMMWATLAQTGLFAAYGVAHLQTIDKFRLVISVAIAIAGVIVAALNIASVSAAHSEINQLKAKYERIFRKFSKRFVDLPVDDEYWIGVAGNENAHKRGHWLDKVLPIVIICLWFMLTVWAFYKNLVSA